MVGAIFLISAGIVFWIAFSLSPTLTQNFVSEDGYFYIKTAHNFSSDLKFTFDGINETNGFHVLQMAVLVLLDKVVALEGLQGVRAVIILHGAFSLAAFLLAGVFVAKAMGAEWRPAGIAAVAAGAGLYSVGTEAALLLFVGWGFLLALFVQQRNLLSGSRKRSDEIWVTALAAAVSLARLDAALLVFACAFVFGTWHFIQGARREALLTVTVTILPALAIVAGETFVNLALTGHPSTISAYLKNDFPDFLNNGWFDSQGLRDKARVVLPPLLALAAAPLLISRVRGISPANEGAAWLCLLGFNLYTVVYSVSLYFFAIGEGTLRTGGVQEWYFVLTISAASINALVLAQAAIRALSRRLSGGGLIGQGLVTWAPLLVAVLVLLVGGTRFYRYYQSHPTTDVIDMETAAWMRENLPEDARVYVIDHSGILGYFSERAVVNGDGLINGWTYLDALRDGRLEEWLAENQIDYMAVGTAFNDAVGRVETREGETFVVALLELRGAKKHELVAKDGDELYQASERWVFPMAEVSVRVLD